MKKLLWILLLSLAVVVLASYVLIPETERVSKVAKIKANHNTIYRALTDKDILPRLLKSSPTSTVTNSKTFTYHSASLHFQERLNDIVEITIDQHGYQSKSFLKIVPLEKDTALVEWHMPLQMSKNPFIRIQQYWQAKAIKSNMTSFINDLDSFATQTESVYGNDIKRAKLTDSLLLTTKRVTKENPTPEFYYGLIKQLQDYATAQNANPVNYPMLNITPIEKDQYEVRVALPVNKEVPDNGSILFKRMVPGNILITEVKGGLQTIDSSFTRLSNYMSDHGLVAPAIPFQSMVTDRLANKDSNQWITKLHYPIF
jgi:hypothetical protein